MPAAFSEEKSFAFFLGKNTVDFTIKYENAYGIFRGELKEMNHKSGAFIAVTFIAALLLQFMAIVPALANYVSLSNRYIEVRIGTGGDKVSVNEGDFETSGRWAVLSQEGDPEVDGDNRVDLIRYAETSPLGDWGFMKVRVADQSRIVGEPSTGGGWVKVPTAYPEPLPGMGLGKSGGFIEGEWRTDDAVGIRVKIRASLVRDQVRFEYTLVNPTNVAKNVAFEMMGDVQVDANDRSGYPFVPGIGFDRISGSGNKPYGLLLKGNKIPEYIEFFDDGNNPVTVARNTLKQQDCVAPDLVALGEWNWLTQIWLDTDGYAPNPLDAIEDLTWLLCWSPRFIAPGGSLKIVTYYGMGAASAQWTYKNGRNLEVDSAVLAVQGPRTLKYNSINNLNTNPHLPEIDPSTFAVKSYIYNMATDPGPYNLEDVTLSIFLPDGLQLVSGSAQQEVGRVPINSESIPVSWTLQATGEFCGELEYMITARDNVTGWQQTVSRKVMVPATKSSLFKAGWQLMSVPYSVNATPSDAFGLTPGSFGAKYYDPTTRTYLPVTQLDPGKAFWMFVGGMTAGQTLPFLLPSDSAIVGEELGKQLEEKDVDLGTGWNMIGNPLIYPVYWGQVLVYNKAANISVTLDQAVANNWITKTIFTWNSDRFAYDNLKDNESLLLPWKGYWVRTKLPVTLVFRPAAFPLSDVTALPGGF